MGSASMTVAGSAIVVRMAQGPVVAMGGHVAPVMVSSIHPIAAIAVAATTGIRLGVQSDRTSEYPPNHCMRFY
jgi:hypothetical protein